MDRAQILELKPCVFQLPCCVPSGGLTCLSEVNRAFNGPLGDYSEVRHRSPYLVWVTTSTEQQNSVMKGSKDAEEGEKEE